jgi:hypothetical protein
MLLLKHAVEFLSIFIEQPSACARDIVCGQSEQKVKQKFNKAVFCGRAMEERKGKTRGSPRKPREV